MGYAPLSKVLSIYTRVEELALPLAQPEDVLVIHRGQPQVGHHHQHRHRHHARHELVVVLDQRVVAQNRVARCAVSPMTIAEYKIMRKWVKIMKFLYCVRKKTSMFKTCSKQGFQHVQNKVLVVGDTE